AAPGVHPGRRRGLQRALAAVAAALALALALVGAHAARLADQVTELEAQLARPDRTGALGTLVAAPDLRSVALEGADGAVRFLWSDQLDRGVLAADGLDPLPASRSYQLWLFHDGAPRPAGLLRADGTGTVEVAAVTVRGAETVAITIEPRAGSPNPSGPVVASAHL
ncbi:MAG TPA: anti-sigma factor, partial [Egibacteraceae bacterium]|nr:anti-sigma factor [Egibacteraceae bacterium]